jgi:isoleucyl-tRNA synthetase
VWECETDAAHRTVIGSYRELADRWGQPLPDDFDPHKPFIDDYTFGCDHEGCGGTMRRVPAVIDAWFDSGAMPYAQWHYPFEHEPEFTQHFPADFICEGLDQTRGWFYSLLAIAAGVSDTAAYRNVVVNGLVLDADGRKMSKRIGNVVDPWAAVAEFGADAVRLYLLASSQVWLPKRFDPQAIREVAAGFLNRLRNTYGFFALYAEDWSPPDAPPLGDRPLVDRWLARRTRALVADVRAAWSGFDVTAGVRAIIEFCDNDLSNWYVRVNRRRFWAPDATADPAAVATLYDSLVTVSRLLAPAAPFLSDAIHRRLTGTSVHLAPFPEGCEATRSEVETAMAAIRRLATLARAAREEGGLRIRQPLAQMRVAVPAASRGAAFDGLLDILAREVNVRQIDVVSSDEDLVRLRAKPNFRTLGKRYGKDTPVAAKAAAQLSRTQLQALEGGKTATVNADGRAFDYHPEDVVVEREVTSDWLVQSNGPYVAALNPTLDEELRLEGLAREVINRVQRLRKEAGYDYNTRIALSISGAEVVRQAVERFRTMVGGETLALQLELGSENTEFDGRESVTIDEHAVTISVRRSERQTP